MFTLSSTSSTSEFWLISHASLQEKSELKVLKNIKFSGEIFNNQINYLFGTNVDNTFE